MSPEDIQNSTREAARDAAIEAMEVYSQKLDLKLANSEQRIAEAVRSGVDEGLEKYMGMSSIEHAMSHHKGEQAHERVEEVSTAARGWFIKAIVVGALMTAGVGLKAKADEVETVEIANVREEQENDSELERTFPSA